MGTLSAYFVGAKGTIKIFEELSGQLGVDYYSGTNYSDTIGVGTKTSYTFNKLYGTNHSFNGSMEYWSTLPSGGLTDYYGGITYKFSKDFSIDLTGHLFSLAQAMYQGKTLLNNTGLGSELDLTVNYQWSKDLVIQGGYSTYFITSTTTLYSSITTSTDSPQWAYVMLTVKPTLFKSSN
jgi:hypothetical protein